MKDRIYIGWTPCFRNEPVIDRYHQSEFIKLELYCPVTNNVMGKLEYLMDQSQEVFNKLTNKKISKEWISSDFCDLMLNGIEIGSYGIRYHPVNQSTYIFGTALAEPRFSEALTT